MKFLNLLFLAFSLMVLQSVQGQIVRGNFVEKTYENANDTIQLAEVAISKKSFKVSVNDRILSPENYHINYDKAILILKDSTIKNPTVAYYKFPDFITKNYSPYNPKLIVPKANPQQKKYSIAKDYSKADFFGGLETYGNITRGITVGNNQGSVLNSGLDLQISGKLSKDLNIRASIKDTNVPLQENGVSQSINEFDRVYMELFTKKWNITAGDVDLQNKESYFLNFTKKITGARLTVDLESEASQTQVIASGALVKGQFLTQNITAIEGNQGPYQLNGPNGEVNIIVISGSETIYVNGVIAKRGEQNDYTIDYNTGQITFNATFPINANQRIIADFQYNDRSYNRFVTYDGVKFKKEKFSIATYFYNENDVKSQPLQQSLESGQIEILRNAGNDPSKMIGESAVVASFDDNRVQYIKNAAGNFEFSTDENAELYNVQFNFVGQNQGNYILKETIAIGKIHEFIGGGLGDFEPVVLLSAPTKIQVATIQSAYQWTEKSGVQAELAYSNNDQNLFSEIDDNQNQGFAGQVNWQQQISSKKWNINNNFSLDFVHQNFNNIEGLYNVEFNRDWNITAQPIGDQKFVKNQLNLSKDENNKVHVFTEYLSFGDDFKGFKNVIDGKIQGDKHQLKTNTSLLQSEDINDKGQFIRSKNQLILGDSTRWLATDIDFEKNDLEDKITQQKNNINHQLINAGLRIGIGDSTKVFTIIGYHKSLIDSIKTNQFKRVQSVDNFSLKNQWLKSDRRNLSTFINYRKINNNFIDDQEVLNGRVQYQQQFFKGLINWNTLYETSSGNTPQQDFTYIETESGQGFYTFLGDLNNNGTKDFNEFEVAQFQDQANYLRVALPIINNVATQKAKVSQSLFVNFSQFQNKKSKWLKTLSHFSNQSSILIDNNQIKKGKDFNINPFDTNNDDVIGLRENIRSSLFFNRGQQKYSTTYSYIQGQNTQRFSADKQSQENVTHQIEFQHNIKHSWLFNVLASQNKNNSISENFNNRNFNLDNITINPSVSFLNNEYSKFKALYTYKNTENTIGEEDLEGHEFGLNFEYNHKDKGSILSNFNWIENDYTGANNTPASYTILKGLQPGRNFTWSLIVQKKLTSLLDLSITYNGRKDELNNAIHTGNVQLRANF